MRRKRIPWEVFFPIRYRPLTIFPPRGKISGQKDAGVVELGSDGSAAGGGRSDLSEWPRSARRETVLTGEADAGHRNRTITRKF